MKIQREKRVYWTKRQRLLYKLGKEKPQRYTRKQMKWLRFMKSKGKDVVK